MNFKLLALSTLLLSSLNSENIINNVKSKVESKINKIKTTQIEKDKFERAKTSLTSTSLPAARKLTIQEATLKAVNSVRAKNQTCAAATKPLRWNKRLYAFAKEHSIDMAVTKKLSHNGSGTKTDLTALRLNLKRGSHFYERVNQKKDSQRIFSGELIIRSSVKSLKSPKELIDYWMKNPKDCKVIMDSRFSDVALAKVISNKDQKSYWTLLFAGVREKK